MLIFKKEKQARAMVLEHLKLVRKCLVESRDSLEEYVVDNLDSATEKADLVSQIESDADTMVRQIRESLLDGAFLPQIRSDVYRLVEAVDSVAGMSEEISQFIITQSPKIPDEFQADLLEIYRQSLNCFNELRKALKDYFEPEGKLDNLLEHFTRVCDFESEVDALQSALSRKVFASQLELSEKLHLQQLIKRIGFIADLSEDAADELEFAAMKSVV